MTFLMGTSILLALMVFGIPIAFALGLAGVASLAMIVPANSIIAIMTKVVHSTVANNLLLTIPMFVLMAEFLSCGGVAEDLLLSCNRLLRRIRGGMAMACIMAGVVHAAATGSSAASAASLARASFPAMRRAGYAPSFAAGTIAIAGTLAIMIPPSVPFVLYGVVTETSVGKLFLAGIVPGILTAMGYMLTISVVLHFWPHLGPANVKKEEEAVQATMAGAKPAERAGNIWPMVVLIFIILGGLYSGVATPTEVSALGALGALVISYHSRRMTRHNFLDAIGATLRITTMIIAIIFGAHFLGYFVSFSKVTDSLLFWIAQSGMPATAVMLIIVFIYLMLGMILDQGAIIILTAPITTALMIGLGYDPVWWGVIIIKTAEIGLIHPPLGMALFVTSSVTRTDMKSCFIGIIPYLITELILLGVLIAFPQISLALVN